MKTRVYERFDFSAGIQQATSWLNRRMNELEDARNARFNIEIGAAIRRNGYIKASPHKFSESNKAPVGFHTAQFSTGAVKLIAVNSEDNTNTIIRRLKPDGTYETLISDLPPNAEVHFCDFRDEVYVSGFTVADGMPFQPRNIDKDLDVSLTRNLLLAPWSKYFVVYRGVLYAANVKIGEDRFQDRFYKSSAPTGAITFVRGAQTDPVAPLTYVLMTPPMTSNTAPVGVASQSSASAGFEGFRAFDQLPATNAAGRWVTAVNQVTNQWVSYDLGVGVTKVLKRYSIVFPNAGALNRAPKTWVLEGSNNGTTWVSVHSVTNAPVWNMLEERTYDVSSNTTAYRYYRLFINSNQGATDNTQIAELKLYATVQSSAPMQLNVDIVRYLKPGMNVSVYKAGKTNKLYDFIISDVNKFENWIQFVSRSWTATSVTAATDIIVTSTAHNLVNGSPVKITSSNAMPAPIVAGNIYYAIVLSATTLKLATTLDNALIGAGIDITSTGSGTIYVNESYVFNNNDEIWLTDRYGKLTSFWNTDYPTPDKADWSAVQPGSDSSNEITGVKEGSNRLFIFTLNSASRFDGTNTIPFSKTVGCASQRSIQNIDDDWIIWLTARGRVYARNEASGQQEYISRGLANRFFNKLTLSQLKASAAGISDTEYTIYVGELNGKKSRAVYDFGSNTWTIDEVNHSTLMYANDSTSGFIKPYFLSNNGYLYQDDTGNTDDGEAIRLFLDLGRVNYGTEAEKYVVGNYIYSENAKGVKVGISFDGGETRVVGELAEDFGRLEYNLGQNSEAFRGSVVRVVLMSAVKGPAQKIYAVHDYFNIAEENTGNGKKQ